MESVPSKQTNAHKQKSSVLYIVEDFK